MKFGWYVDQRAIADLGLIGKIDLVDVAILMYIKDLCAYKGVSTVHDEGKVFYWLAYKAVIEELPMIGIHSKNVIYKRFKKLCALNLLEQHKDNENLYRPYYALGSEFEKLITKREKKQGDPPPQKNTPPSPKEYAPPPQKETYYNIIDPSASSLRSEPHKISSRDDFASHSSSDEAPTSPRTGFNRNLEVKEVFNSTFKVQRLLISLYRKYPTWVKEDIRRQFEKAFVYLMSSKKEYKDQELFINTWFENNKESDALQYKKEDFRDETIHPTQDFSILIVKYYTELTKARKTLENLPDLLKNIN